MRHVLNTGAAFALAAALAACATGYQESGITGGFEETQLAPNVFQVRFQGNAYTKPERAADYALLRSAEVALENGFTHFVIVEAKDATKLSTWTPPSTSTTSINARKAGDATRATATTRSNAQTVVFQKPSTANTIVCFKEQPEIDGLVYDAAFLRASLRKKYGMKD